MSDVFHAEAQIFAASLAAAEARALAAAEARAKVAPSPVPMVFLPARPVPWLREALEHADGLPATIATPKD